MPVVPVVINTKNRSHHVDEKPFPIPVGGELNGNMLGSFRFSS